MGVPIEGDCVACEYKGAVLRDGTKVTCPMRGELGEGTFKWSRGQSFFQVGERRVPLDAGMCIAVVSAGCFTKGVHDAMSASYQLGAQLACMYDEKN